MSGVEDDVVEVAGLRHAYRLRAALDGVDLRVTRGEAVAITGPSGSGKSTLLHAVGGVLVPDEGDVRVVGEDVRALGEDGRSRLRRTRVGILFQHGQLVDELSLLENVALPLLLEGRRRGEAEETAAAWLRRVGVADLADRLPTEVSGGQLQRAALARALVPGPDVLLADEPTGALDSRAGEQIMELVAELAEEERMTVLLVTHDARVAAYADREVVLRDGRVDEPVASERAAQ